MDFQTINNLYNQVKNSKRFSSRLIIDYNLKNKNAADYHIRISITILLGYKFILLTSTIKYGLVRQEII